MEVLLDEVGAPERRYVSSVQYPDEELFALVLSASRELGTTVAETLERFGQHLAGGLARSYESSIDPEWRTLDLLEHTEGIIHRAVRATTPGATPPFLTCERQGPEDVLISYHSQRRMCALAKGIIRGVAGMYGETVATTDEACMLQGDASCEIRIRLLRAPAEGASPLFEAPA